MFLTVKNKIYQAILSNKWLEINYINKNNEVTNFYIGITDIDPEKNTIKCYLFNAFKQDKLKNDGSIVLHIDKIKNCEINENTFFKTPTTLKEKISKIENFFELNSFDNNILEYLHECYVLDNDPCLKNSITLEGLDLNKFLIKKELKLCDEDFRKIIDNLFKNNLKQVENQNRSFVTLCINLFSIDLNSKQYVVAYKEVYLDFATKTLSIANNVSINKTFLIDGFKISLSNYLEGVSSSEFETFFEANFSQYKALIEKNYNHNEKSNTRPNLFVLEKSNLYGVSETLNQIHVDGSLKQLSSPLKAYFGRNRSKNSYNKDINIAIFDKNKINIDQIRAIYNASVNKITYVIGPPGTGKTETIFNLLLTNFFNNRTVLICSNNNKPLIDIEEKFRFLLGDLIPGLLFPIIKISNNEVTKDSLVKLKDIYNFVLKNKKLIDKYKTIKISKDLSTGLSDAISYYEVRHDLIDKKDRLLNIKKLNNIKLIDKSLDNEINLILKELKKYQNVNDSEIYKRTLSIIGNEKYKNYLRYLILLRYKKLLTEPYEKLKNILFIDDLDERLVAFNKYIHDDTNLSLFLNVFPFIISTNLSSFKLGSPRIHFDEVVMDESAQSNILTSLIPIIRGERLVLVGDLNQLKPVCLLDLNINKRLMNNFQISKEYNYTNNSILKLMMVKDKNSKQILLREHYRCARKIASFSNKRFYDNELILKNINVGNLTYIDVMNQKDADTKNAYQNEALSIVNFIKKNNYQNVGIITPFVNQARLINNLLNANDIKNVKAGTIHTFQGSEYKTIILSNAISLSTSKKTMNWIEDNKELINVAITRAKENFVFVGDKKAIELKADKNSNLYYLSKYVESNGKIDIPKDPINVYSNFSNNSQNESEFFKTIEPYFNYRKTRFKVLRNVPVKDVFVPKDKEDAKLIGEKEFDVVIYLSTSFFNKSYKPICIFEINGGEHLGSNKQIKYDNEKRKLLNKYGLKLFIISNNSIKDYELIINLFKNNFKKLSKEVEYEQVSLYE